MSMTSSPRLRPRSKAPDVSLSANVKVIPEINMTAEYLVTEWDDKQKATGARKAKAHI